MAPAAPPLRTTQLVLVALAMGVLAFTAVAVALRLSTALSTNPEAARFLPVSIAGLVACEAVAYSFLRRTLVARTLAARAESLELVRQGRVPVPLHTLAILGAALAEGAGLLGVISVLLGGPWLALSAPAMAVALILCQMPTRERLERIVRDE